ncbi:hypothetical protein ABIB38_003337 [Massilia sp. UYP11]
MRSAQSRAGGGEKFLEAISTTPVRREDGATPGSGAWLERVT